MFTNSREKSNINSLKFRISEGVKQRSLQQVEL